MPFAVPFELGISLKMAEYPVKSTSQSTYGRMERTLCFFNLIWHSRQMMVWNYSDYKVGFIKFNHHRLFHKQDNKYKYLNSKD